MRCPRCKVVSMYDDPDRIAGIQVYACLTCGNRVYVGYPKRKGDNDPEEKGDEGRRTPEVLRGAGKVIPLRRAPTKGRTV